MARQSEKGDAAERGRLLAKRIADEVMPLSREYRSKLSAKEGIGNLTDREIMVIRVLGKAREGMSVTELARECSERLKRSAVDDPAGVSTVATAVNRLWDMQYLTKTKHRSNQKITIVSLTPEGVIQYDAIRRVEEQRALVFGTAAEGDYDAIIRFVDQVVELLKRKLTE